MMCSFDVAIACGIEVWTGATFQYCVCRFFPRIHDDIETECVWQGEIAYRSTGTMRNSMSRFNNFRLSIAQAN